MIHNLLYNKYYYYFKNKLKIKIMLHKIKIDNLENIMKNLNFKKIIPTNIMILIEN